MAAHKRRENWTVQPSVDPHKGTCRSYQGIHTLWQRSKPHTIPLLLVAIAAALGQIATLIQQPLVSAYDDTPTYVLAAHGIATSFSGLVPGFRTPGYPLLLAIVLRLAGGVNYQTVAGCAIATSSLPSCQLALQPVVIAQAAIAVLTTFECYVLAFQLTHQRWSASLVASLIGVNLYMLSWERTVLSELLSYWALVTTFLCFERLVRRSTLGAALLIAVASFFLSLLQFRQSIHTIGTSRLTAITDQNTMSPHSLRAAAVTGEAIRSGEGG